MDTFRSYIIDTIATHLRENTQDDLFTQLPDVTQNMANDIDKLIHYNVTPYAFDKAIVDLRNNYPSTDPFYELINRILKQIFQTPSLYDTSRKNILYFFLRNLPMRSIIYKYDYYFEAKLFKSFKIHNETVGDIQIFKDWIIFVIGSKNVKMVNVNYNMNMQVNMR
jgi:hypothetical protein